MEVHGDISEFSGRKPYLHCQQYDPKSLIREEDDVCDYCQVTSETCEFDCLIILRGPAKAFRSKGVLREVICWFSLLLMDASQPSWLSWDDLTRPA